MANASFPSPATTASGAYTGDQTMNRQIQVPFQPSYIVLMEDTGVSKVIIHAMDVNGTNVYIYNGSGSGLGTAAFTFNASGFLIAGPTFNSVNGEYSWVAVK